MTGPPLHGAWVAVGDGRIQAVGDGPVPESIELGRVAVLPALVNAHTHLELSHLRGAVPPSHSLVDWVQRLLARRNETGPGVDSTIRDAVVAAIQEARTNGTGLIGDVGNSLVSVPLLSQAGMPARVFYELLGFRPGDPARQIHEAALAVAALSDTYPDVPVALAAHAPYSVSPDLFRGIRGWLDAADGRVSSVHLGESPEETEFIERGTGPWRDFLHAAGAWNNSWRLPGRSPVDYLIDLGFLDRRVLAVHGVQLNGDDLSHLSARGVTIVSCPRSNRHVGVGSPPIEAFYAMDVPVAFGTDSLASTADLNLFAELAEARRLAPRVPARRLLESATLTGARALGFGEQYGSIEAGKRASLIAVDVPDGIDDVEEYLVRGIESESVTWLDAGA